jgi:hypothetical protein
VVAICAFATTTVCDVLGAGASGITGLTLSSGVRASGGRSLDELEAMPVISPAPHAASGSSAQATSRPRQGDGRGNMDPEV